MENSAIDHREDVAEQPATKAEEVDIEIGRKLAAKRDRPWARKLDAIGKLGDQEPLYAMGFATLVAGVLIRDPRLRLAGVSVVAQVAAADLAKQAVKGVVKRTRPHKLLDDGHYEAGVGDAVDEKPYQSFPSGHVACTLAAACAAGSVYPQTRGAGAVATGVIAVARMVKGAHWPLDILGGVVVGAVASTFVAGLFKMQGSWEARRD